MMVLPASGPHRFDDRPPSLFQYPRRIGPPPPRLHVWELKADHRQPLGRQLLRQEFAEPVVKIRPGARGVNERCVGGASGAGIQRRDMILTGSDREFILWHFSYQVPLNRFPNLEARSG